MDDKAGSKRGSKRKRFLYLIMVAFLALFFLQWFFNNTTELSPNRGDDIESASRLLALLVGLALLTIAGLIKPVTGISRPAFIMVGGALGTVFGYLVGLVVIGTVYRAYDFSGPNTILNRPGFVGGSNS